MFLKKKPINLTTPAITHTDCRRQCWHTSKYEAFQNQLSHLVDDYGGLGVHKLQNNRKKAPVTNRAWVWICELQHRPSGPDRAADLYESFGLLTSHSTLGLRGIGWYFGSRSPSLNVFSIKQTQCSFHTLGCTWPWPMNE